MDSGLFKRRKMAIRLGLGLMVVVIISDFFLYPRQYSYPSSVSEYSTQENNDKRYFLRQQIENSKTYEQMKLRVRSSQYISQENLYDKVDPKKQQNFQEDTSRKRGEQILENKGMSSTASANSSDGSRIKNKTGKSRQPAERRRWKPKRQIPQKNSNGRAAGGRRRCGLKMQKWFWTTRRISKRSCAQLRQKKTC